MGGIGGRRGEQERESKEGERELKVCEEGKGGGKKGRRRGETWDTV